MTKIKIPAEAISQAAREMGRRGDLATAARLTPEQRSARARKAALALAAQRQKEAAAHA